MYVQLITGKTDDPAAIRERGARWATELRPGARGFLGSTGGASADGTVVVLARFSDEAAARANSDRPEQGAWWEATAKLFSGEPSFRESSDVRELFGGGSDDATFVQVIEGRVLDRAKIEAFESEEMLQQLRAARPDLLGGLTVFFDDDHFVELAYFTDEAAARSGESSDEFSGPQQEYANLFADVTYVDLQDPLLVGPA